jgi:RNA polymerase sigma-70 factor (ECF subfamily)
VHGDRHLDDFTRCYQRDASRVIRTVALVTGEPGLAEEVVAEAFARAWLRWPQLRSGGDSPRTWITHVALNLCRGRFRRRQVERRKAHLVARPDAVVDPDPPTSHVWAAVARLPERERTLVALRYVADLSQEQIAQTLGIAVGTVASGLHRARRRLGVELTTTIEEVTSG